MPPFFLVEVFEEVGRHQRSPAGVVRCFLMQRFPLVSLWHALRRKVAQIFDTAT